MPYRVVVIGAGFGVVCAAGQLGRPALPDITGRDTFAGPWWHSARWNHDVDLAGRRVAGASTWPRTGSCPNRQQPA
jgi:hypothetical protein